MTQEVLKQALEALESMKATLAEHDEPTTFLEDQAIAALRADPRVLEEVRQKSIKHEDALL
jgi:hypothetical protein